MFEPGSRLDDWFNSDANEHEIISIFNCWNNSWIEILLKESTTNRNDINMNDEHEQQMTFTKFKMKIEQIE